MAWRESSVLMIESWPNAIFSCPVNLRELNYWWMMTKALTHTMYPPRSSVFSRQTIKFTLFEFTELLEQPPLSLLPPPDPPRSTSHIRPPYELRAARVCNNNRRNEKSGKLYPFRLLLLFGLPLPLIFLLCIHNYCRHFTLTSVFFCWFSKILYIYNFDYI